MQHWSWHASEPPRTEQTDLSLKVAIASTGWQTALSRSPKIKVHNLRPGVSKPRTVSFSLGQQKIRTFSFQFSKVSHWQDETAFEKDPKDNPSAIASSVKRRAIKPPAGRLTRIKPPGDIIKLEDRLHYLLQPPLETLTAGSSLDFPFDPFPYQWEGIAFLYPRYSAILADEMGLGKTMQAISTIRLLLYTGELKSVLLVCPKPLVSNWQREFTLWAPEIPLTIIEGDQNRRSWQWNLPAAPVKIANYELLVRDRDLVTSPDIHFDLMVLDEAQRIKNRRSTTSQVVCSVSRSRNWALTGTPVENSSEDLVGIFEFLSPGYLSSEMNLRRLGQAARQYTLRRTKEKVLTDLPPKLYRDAEVELTLQQRLSYQMAEDEGVVRLNDLGDHLSIQHVFELVLRLKQICNFDPVTQESSKLERLAADLEEVVASGQKAIVFSQWVRTITRLSERLERFGPLEYHGKIPHRRREGVIEKFKNSTDHHVLLMSYGAGSVGLNLQFCGYVFLFDRWWNPAVEDQAINRAHRIGVTGPVTVSRFLALDTIEQRIDEILCRKRELFEAIFSHADSHHKFGMSQQEIFGLFNLKTSPGPISKAA